MADIIKPIITRLDTTANWTTLNPTPANGEQCIEILKQGLFKLKVGDGVTPWIALQYETLGDGYSKFKILLDKEIHDRQEADDKKLDKSDEKGILYGTDLSGNQVVYSINDVGKVDDVQVKGAYQTEYESVLDDRVAHIDLVSEKVEYTTNAVEDIGSVKEALDLLINFHYYVEPAGTLSATNGGYYEVGDIINTQTLTWNITSFNKAIDAKDTLVITGPNGFSYNIISQEPQSKWKSGSLVLEGLGITTDQGSYTLQYIDKHSAVPTGKKDSFTTPGVGSITFRYRKYAFPSEKETIANEDILSLNALPSALSNSDSNGGSISMSAQAFKFTNSGKYFYFAIPSSTLLGKNITFKSGTSVESLAPQQGCYIVYTMNDFTNAKGVNVPLTIYKHKLEPDGTMKKVYGNDMMYQVL